MHKLTALVVLAACDQGSSEHDPPPTRPDPPAVMASADAAVVDVIPAGTLDLGRVGVAAQLAGGVRSILLADNLVYWSTDTDDLLTTIRRMPRAGGPIETLAAVKSGDGVEDHRNFALLNGELVVMGATIGTSNDRAPLFKVANGKLRELARGPRGTFASTGLLAANGKVYWTARGTTGSGPLMETTPTGATRTILCESSAGFRCEHHVLDGTAPIATDGSSLWQLGDHAQKLSIRCPDCTE